MKISAPLAVIAVLFCISEGVAAQSLWSPAFKGYLTGRSSLQIGDLVSVTIDTNTKLSYTSSNVSDRTLTLEFKGGGNPLSFLPPGSSSDKTNLKGGEDITLSTKLVAQVKRLDPNGQAYVEGSRTLEVNGRAEMLSVSGWLAPSMMTGGNTIPFDDLADSKLVYSSTLIQSAPVLTQGDITQALAQASGPSPTPQTTGTPSGGTTPGSTAPGTPSTPSAGPTVQSSGTGGSGQSATSLQITDAKKRQLLLDYLNKMLDLMFSKGSP